jgi:hypothetical protein
LSEFPTRNLSPRFSRELQAPVRETFATAAEEWLRFVEQERGVKPSTLRDYKSAVRKHFVGTDDDPGWLREVELRRVTPALIER